MSVAYQLIPDPDWATTTTVSLPEGLDVPADRFARAVFQARSVPAWGKALFVAREVAAVALRLPPARRDMLAVREVRDGEAVIDTDDVHLRFVAGIRTEPRLAHVTTAVRFKGLRGRLYFVPVRLVHDPITRAMMRRAVRSLARDEAHPSAADGPLAG